MKATASLVTLAISASAGRPCPPSSGALPSGLVGAGTGSDGSTLLSFPGLDPGEMLGLEAIVIEDVNGDGNSDYLISSGRKEVFVAAGVVL